MNLPARKLRAQSAMEYLMTYGWAILIIGVVLGVLFSMGVFNSSSLVGTTCRPITGYYCENPVLINTTGQLTLTIGQGTGTTYSNVIAYIVPSGSTFNTSAPSNSIGILNSGQTVSPTFNLASLPSIKNSLPLPVGTVFTGQVWLVYNSVYASIPAITTQIATFSVKAS